jgi:hypothetical protein
MKMIDHWPIYIVVGRAEDCSGSFQSCLARNQTTMPHLSNLWHSHYTSCLQLNILPKFFTWLKVIRYDSLYMNKNDNPAMNIHTCDLEKELQWHIAPLNRNKETDLSTITRTRLPTIMYRIWCHEFCSSLCNIYCDTKHTEDCGIFGTTK